MYKTQCSGQQRIEEFRKPFAGKLCGNNRWVRLAQIMPWELIERRYAESFSEEKSRYPISARIAFGAIYIKEQEKLRDRSTLTYISENPYAQYFLGLEEFTEEPLFDASMMVHFRKRFSAEVIEEINQAIFLAEAKAAVEEEPEDSGSTSKSPDAKEDSDDDDKLEPPNSGKLILDATCAPSDIRYPTDLSLLNECRENCEKIIDELWEYQDKKERGGHKTPYHRRKARAAYLAIIRQKKAKASAIKEAISQQLGYVWSCICMILMLLGQVDGSKVKQKTADRFELIRKVYEQQKAMADTDTKRCEDRIVSLRQPHVRPIVRGKAGKPYEFGQKLAFSVVGGYTFIEKQGWDNFNEGITLTQSAERYKERFGAYPKAILADKIYRNQENRKFCKKHHIRLSGPRLGRPKASEVEQDREIAYKDNCERNIVESRNGIVKRRFGLDLILAYLPETAETEAALNVLAMNLCLRLKVLCAFCLDWFCTVVLRGRTKSQAFSRPYLTKKSVV